LKAFLISLWRAASSPAAFFRWLEPQPTRLLQGGGVACGSLVVLSLAAALGFARATASDAYLPLMTFALIGAGAFFLYSWAFGGIFLQRPGALDVRAWEVAGWSWTPALFVGVSMLVPLWVVPVPALVLTLLAVLVWHLTVLRAGLAIFLERPANTVVALYALFIYVLPLLLLGFIIWFSLRFG